MKHVVNMVSFTFCRVVCPLTCVCFLGGRGAILSPLCDSFSLFLLLDLPAGKWDKLPRFDFPVLFHGVIGEDMREERSPSFFNPQEVAIVVQYVEELMAYRKVKLKETDIGVISPYRKQVHFIRFLTGNAERK